MLRTVAYIDGFNLYYRMLKSRPEFKWFNPKQLIQELLSNNHNVIKVNYYIARVAMRPHDPLAPARQAVYLNALSSVPEISIHEGNFMTSEVWMPLVTPAQCRPMPYTWTEPCPNVVRVIKSEEKGSDVNLASHLVRDAFLDAFDVAVIVTNDSDLVEPIRIATVEAGKRVGLLVPVKAPNQSLIDAASFHLRIRNGHLKKAQFASPLLMPDGSLLAKPATWV